MAQAGFEILSAAGNVAAAQQSFQQGDNVGVALNLISAAGSIVGLRNTLNACFAKGTPLWWEHGYKAIEEFKPGEKVWARDENAPNGLLFLRVIKKVFQRTGQVLELQVGGKVIRTTPEHPFSRKTLGWTAAKELRPGDLLATSNPELWMVVERVVFTDEVTTVYNFEIADCHTYFVGDSEWDFALWAHNADCATASEVAKFSKGGFSVKSLKSLAPETHHIATIYGDVGRRMKGLFDSVGLSMESAWNKTRISGHIGPHGSFYNEYVYSRLRDALGDFSGFDRVNAMLDALYDLRRELNNGNLDALLKVASMY